MSTETLEAIASTNATRANNQVVHSDQVDVFFSGDNFMLVKPLDAQITELRKQVTAYQQTDRVLAEEEGQTHYTLVVWKVHKSLGLIFIPDEKRSEYKKRAESELRRLSAELQQIQAKRADNAKLLAATEAVLRQNAEKQRANSRTYEIRRGVVQAVTWCERSK